VALAHGLTQDRRQGRSASGARNGRHAARRDGGLATSYCDRECPVFYTSSDFQTPMCDGRPAAGVRAVRVDEESTGSKRVVRDCSKWTNADSRSSTSPRPRLREYKLRGLNAGRMGPVACSRREQRGAGKRRARWAGQTFQVRIPKLIGSAAPQGRHGRGADGRRSLLVALRREPVSLRTARARTPRGWRRMIRAWHEGRLQAAYSDSGRAG